MLSSILFPRSVPLLRALRVSVVLIVLSGACFADEADDSQAAKDTAIVETVVRLDGFDLNSSKKAKAAVLRFLKRNRGSERYFELVERFELSEIAGDLLQLTLEKPGKTAGVKAAKLLVKLGQFERLEKILLGDDEARAAAAATALGFVDDKQAGKLLSRLVSGSEPLLSVRAAAVRSLGRSRDGERSLLQIVEAGKLPDDLKFAAANVLLASRDPNIQQRAGKYLELPNTAGKEPLPPIATLVRRRGDVGQGKTVFAKKGICINCHQVGTEGKQVGPALTEIGDKLSREAFYVSILDPSAGISHNYETYELVTAKGRIVTGVLVNKTDESVTIKNAEAIEQTYPTGDIDELTKLKTSLMPADLQKNLTLDELVDLVEYLTTLKKR